MNGPEHYREAERILDFADQSRGWDRDALLAAQVHATLALAAASACPAVQDYYGVESSAARDWAEVAE